MQSTKMIAAICLSATIYLSACASIQVGQQVQAGRNALQTGRPNDAVSLLMAAAETDPGYRIPYRVGEGVLTYFGRAYYETGRNKDAQLTLEKAVTRDPDDHLVRVYLGLTRLRDGEPDRGRRKLNPVSKVFTKHWNISPRITSMVFSGIRPGLSVPTSR